MTLLCCVQWYHTLNALWEHNLTRPQLFGIAYTICIDLSVNDGLGRAADELDASRMESLSKVRVALGVGRHR